MIAICTLIIVSTGMWVGISLIRNKKYKYGVLILIGSLGVLGGLGFLNNLSVTINNIKKEMGDLKIEVKQSLSLKQEISTTVNAITRVEKEVAGMQEVISSIYKNIKTNKFKSEDLDKKVKVFPNSRNPNFSIVFFELETIPLENSIELSCRQGTRSPSTLKIIKKNIVAYEVEIPPNRFLRSENDFYSIRYIPDVTSNQELVTIEGMQYSIVDKTKYTVNFNPKKQ
ncbi:MAG: hypothetical protein PHO03_00740 [Candidatus Omnitrophica bacterium]|nr:hypothetical protein [Candidatus Omnitrophota bacterium]